jgi:hypothetical protein
VNLVPRCLKETFLEKFLEIFALVMLFLAVVFLPLYIDTNHEVGGDDHFM